MTFLSPSVFWLLGALSIPIIIHILNRFRLRKVEYSSIAFIDELRSSAIYRLNLRKVLILILRLLFLTSLIFMFARPVTKGFIPGWFAGEKDASLVIIIDNSASMTSTRNGKSYLDISKNEVMALLPNFKEETQIIISQTCPQKIVFKGLNTSSDIRNSIKYIEPTNDYDSLWESINNVIIDEDINGVIKECVVFSDFMHYPDSAFIKDSEDRDNWKFYFIKHGKMDKNLGVTSVSFLNRMKMLNQLISIETNVKNTGNNNLVNIPIELSFNSQRVGQVITEFKPDFGKSFLFQAYPIKDGILESVITLPEDDYLLDNNWYQTVSIMDKINCGVLGPNLEEISLIEMVLQSIDPDGSFLNITRILQPKIKRLFLNDLDVILVHNIEGISEEGVQDLESFLKKGGGIIWFQGDSNVENFHLDLFSRLNFPKQENLVNSGGGVFNTEVISDKSYLLKDLQKRTIEKELPEIFKYIKISNPPNHEVHWKLNNDDPLLLEFSEGIGNIFYFSTLLDFDWTDLPIRGMIVPLLYRLLILTGTDEINTAPVLINEPKIIDIKESNLINSWEVVSPTGRTELIVPNYNKENIKIIQTDELGIYKVYNNRKHFTSFPTRLHYNEYPRPFIDENNLNHIFLKNNLRWINLDENFNEVFSETRHGKSLWNIFLIVAIIFLLV
ncbi:MAG: vWA domain-containing protein, partial [Candidatus Neomarinimicrobiota bacterium]